MAPGTEIPDLPDRCEQRALPPLAPERAPFVATRRELCLPTAFSEPREAWHASAELGLRSFFAGPRASEQPVGRLLVDWLSAQPGGVGLQLLIAADPVVQRCRIGLRIEAIGEEEHDAWANVMGMLRDLQHVLAGTGCLDFVAESASACGIIDALDGVNGGLVAQPALGSLSDRTLHLPLLRIRQPDLARHASDLVRLLLQQDRPCAAVLSLCSRREDRGIDALLKATARAQAGFSGRLEGALHVGRSNPGTSRHFPEDLLEARLATGALEASWLWLRALDDQAIDARVHLVGEGDFGSACKLAAQRALVGGDASWIPLGADQARLVLSGPLTALGCPLATDDGEDCATVRAGGAILPHLLPPPAAAHALDLTGMAASPIPGVPIDHAPWRDASPALAGVDGALLGLARCRGQQLPIRLAGTDLARHLYVCGKTGTGKTTLLRTLAVDVSRRGEGLILLDPHGDLAREVRDQLSDRPDVVLFDPASGEGPGLDPLANSGSLLSRERAIEGLTSIVFRLYLAEHMGPMFDRFSRALLHPLVASRGGLADVSRLAIDEEFRSECLDAMGPDDPVLAEVRRFWQNEYPAWGRDTRGEMQTYVVSKYEGLVRSSQLRAALDPRRPQLDVRDCLARGKVLIARLPQGELGPVSAWFLGMLLVARVQEAVFARSDVTAGGRVPSTLILDEFQHFLGGGGFGYRDDDRSLGPLLSEARKYGLRLVLAHQHLAQCDARTREAVLGNAGSMVIFRTGHQDAEILARELDGDVAAGELRRLPLFRGVASLLAQGRPQPAFSLETIPPSP